MPDVITSQQDRQKSQLNHRKSKQGCITCKIRRVKCDETRPSCQRCTSTGRRCDGYERTSHASGGSLTLSKQPSHTSGGPQASHREKRAFSFFLDQIATTLSGPLDTTFWSEFIPQLSQANTAIWDALISISCLIEYPQWTTDPVVDTGQDDAMIVNVDHQWALAMYNRSISKVNLLSQSDLPTLATAITTCLLFICIEFLQDNIQRSLQLVGVVQKLINDFQHRGSEPSSSEICAKTGQTAIPLLTRITALMSFAFGRPFLRLAPSPYQQNVQISSISAASSTFYTMVASFDTFIAQSALYKKIENQHLAIPTELRAQQENILSRLYDWHRSVSELTRITNPEDLNLYTLSLCLVHYNIAIIHITNAFSPFECAYDSSIHLFQSIVQHADRVIELGPNNSSGDPRRTRGRPRFMFDTNLISSLYFVAIRCRNPLLRRDAVKLIRKSTNKEGLWNSMITARIAEKAIEIEEEGQDFIACSLLPGEQRRIHNREVHYNKNSTSKQWVLEYTRYSKDESDETTKWTPIKAYSPLDHLDDSTTRHVQKYQFKHYLPRT